MEVLRQAVSVPIFGTVIWMAWVVAETYGATMIAALLVCFLLLAIAGWFLGRWPAKGWSGAIAGLLVVSAVAAAASSAHYLAVAAPKLTVSGMVARRENASLGHWGLWSPNEMSMAVSQGHPVFVDFTAKWCLSCQVNERVALTRPEVMKAFADAQVVLLKADWTQHDDAITQELEKLGRSGVPTYVLYAPGQANPKVLPEALTPGIVIDAVNSLPHAATQNASAASNGK
jgi:thiol:disulfide interchange protein DsbD